MTRGRNDRPGAADSAEAWTRPRRTTSNPGSLRAAHQVFVPPGLADLVLHSKATLLAERRPVQFPPWPGHSRGDGQCDNGSSTAATELRPQLRSYSPDQFKEIRHQRGVTVPPNVALLAAGLRERTDAVFETPQKLPSLGDVFGTSAATPTPSRRRYFEHSELHHRVISVLNKVSGDPQKYAEVRNELHRLPLPATDEQFMKVVGVFFTKAIQEQKFADKYAQLVAEIVNSPGRPTGDEGQSFATRFKRALLDRCQEEYVKSRELLTNADTDNADELTDCKSRLRGTLGFVAHLYVARLLPGRLIIDILNELLEQPPMDADIEGVLAIVKVCASSLAEEEADGLGYIMQAAQMYCDDATVPLPKRVRYLCMDVAEKLRGLVDFPAEATDDNPFQIAHVFPAPPDDALTAKARHVMFTLAQEGDFDSALAQVTSLPHPTQSSLMLAWVHRALTTTRANRERQQLPAFMRLLVARGVLSRIEAVNVFVAWLRQAVEAREWENTKKLWTFWAQVLAEDKGKDAVPSQDLHNYAMITIANSPQFGPADFDEYLRHVLKLNVEAAWDVDMSSATKAPRFRFLAHLVAACTHNLIHELPLATVRKVGLPAGDFESELFVALCEDNANCWEMIRTHPHVLSLVMVQKVMGAILAAAIAMQDDRIATGSMHLLQIVVDGPNRDLREALVIAELMASGALMHSHLRTSWFGFQLSKALKECDVVSEVTMQQARAIYERDPCVMDLIGPEVGRPFVSGPAALAPPPPHQHRVEQQLLLE